MKVGVLTIHRAVNDGSVLQACCVVELLQRRLPEASVEIIDYRPPRLESFERRRLLRRALRPYPTGHLAKRRELLSLPHKRSRISPSIGGTDGALVTKTIAERGYDAVVVGSDTVWQLRRDDLVVPPAPNAYFLPGLAGVRKVGFAISADTTQADVLADENTVAALSRQAADFDLLTFRDEETERVFDRLGVASERRAFLPDPVALVEIDVLANLAGGLRSDRRDPADREDTREAAVAIGSSRMSRDVAGQLRERGYRVTQLMASGGGATPRRLAHRLEALARTDVLVTDRFHSTLLALRLGQARIVGVERAEKYPQPGGKLRDLLTRVGLPDALVRTSGEALTDPVLDGALGAWDAAGADPRGGLERLRRDAEPLLERIATTIRSQ